MGPVRNDWPRHTTMRKALHSDYMDVHGRGMPPLGFRRVAPGRPFQIVTRELVLVETILERRAEGWSLRRIARELTSAGHRTKTGSTRWSAEGVNLIVRRAARYRNALRSRNPLPE